MNKIGRNQKCQCGSNLKYKNCCLKKIQEQEKHQLQSMRISDIIRKNSEKKKKETIKSDVGKLEDSS